MTLLSVVKDVCAATGVAVPTAVFSAINSNRTMQEMLSLANEMAQRTAYDMREWRQLKASQTYAGDGVTTAYNLPANYKRMLTTSNVWRSTSALQPMRFISDTDEWYQRRRLNRADAWGEWTLQGNQMLLDAVMAPGVTATYAYLDKNCINLTSGGAGDAFMQDSDSYRLDERLLKLGMIWQWKALKGSPYAEDMGTWSDAIAMAMGTDKPMPIIIDRRPWSVFPRNVAYPWPLS